MCAVFISRDIGITNYNEMIEWCKDNFDNLKWGCTSSFSVAYFNFSLEEDAMAFKLRWL